ncbi:hypothetical protein GGR92_000024 [Spirosoma lacussanchae]|uniref:hypothetical protein n=1 Tax=Spirosoma lacussanchae TaxID=1884249 RepID=UPI0011092EFE|nr:hypothetical protein [Spirosoma lacussanchae]
MFTLTDFLLAYGKACLYLGLPLFLIPFGPNMLRYFFRDTKVGRALSAWWWSRSDDTLGLYLALGSLLVLVVLTWIRNAK